MGPDFEVVGGSRDKPLAVQEVVDASVIVASMVSSLGVKPGSVDP